jgi:hypothetical protein
MRPASSRLSIGFDWAGKFERICVLIEPGIARRLGEFCGFLRQKKAGLSIHRRRQQVLNDSWDLMDKLPVVAEHRHVCRTRGHDRRFTLRENQVFDLEITSKSFVGQRNTHYPVHMEMDKWTALTLGRSRESAFG